MWIIKLIPLLIMVLYVEAAVPDAVTNEMNFYLFETGENATEMFPGSSKSFELDIHFPGGTTDVRVEIFTPDNDTTLMCLCNVMIVLCGGQIADCASVQAVQPQMETRTPGSLEYDWAILDFGNVTNNNNSAVYEDHIVRVSWDAVMCKATYDPSYNGTTTHTSVGAAYAGDTYIWVAQVAFTLMTSNPQTSHLPTFNMTCPDTMPIGTSAEMLVAMYVTSAAEHLIFDAFSPLNGTGDMAVCTAKVIQVGDNFACLFDPNTILAEHFDSTTYDDVERVRLDLGVVINKESRLSVMDVTQNLILVKVIIHARNDPLLIGNEYWFGAALEIGTYQIWAGQCKVTLEDNSALPAKTAASQAVLTLSESAYSVAIGDLVATEIEIEIPPGEDTEYEVITDTQLVGGEPQFDVCYAAAIFQGENMPCLQKGAVPEYPAPNQQVLKMYIRNTGFFTNSTSHPDKDKIKILRILSIPDHAGASGTVTTTLTNPGQLDVTAPALITIAPASSTPNTSLSSGSYPDLSMNWTWTDGNVPVGGYACLEFEITAKARVIYEPMTTEVITPYDYGLGSALYHICKVEITHMGANFPCTNQSIVEASIVYHSTANDEIYNKVALKFGGLYNIRDPAKPESDDDKIRLSICIRVMDHPNNTVASTNYASVGIFFSPVTLWVGQLALTIPASTFTFQSSDLVTHFVRQDGAAMTDAVKLGSSVVLLYIIKPLNKTQGDLQVKFTASGSETDLRICAARLTHIGANLGCGVNATEIIPTMTDWPATIYYKDAEFPPTIIANLGEGYVNDSEIIDEDSIVFEVVVHVPVTAPGTVSLTAAVLSGGTTVADGSPININTGPTLPLPASTPVNTSPTITFVQGSIRNETIDNNIRPGETKKFELIVTFNPDDYSNNYYKVKFLSPVNFSNPSLEVCGAAVTFVGQNQPCIRKEDFPIGIITSRAGSQYSDIISIDLGYVCHVPLVNDTVEDQIILEVFVRAVAHVLLPTSTEFWVSATAMTNSDLITVLQYSLTLVRSAIEQLLHNPAQAAITFSDLTAGLDISPGATVTLALNITVPQLTTLNVLFDLRVPVNVSAVMTISEIRVKAQPAANLACFTSFPDLDFTPNIQYTKEYGTSQTNYVTLDMGHVTHMDLTTGTDAYTPEDDMFIVEFDVKTADPLISENGTTHAISSVVQMGDAMLVANALATIVRSGNEQADILFNCTVVDDTLVFTDSGVCVNIDCELKHDVLSTAEGQNVTVTLNYPPYIRFGIVTLLNMTETANEPIIANATQGSKIVGVQFQFDHLYFTDIIEWTFSLCVTTPGRASNLKASVIQNSITALEACFQIFPRDNHIDPAGKYYCTPDDPLDYLVQPTVTVDCSASTLSLLDCQLVSREIADVTFPVTSAKIGQPGFKFANRGPNIPKYIELRFGNLTTVTQLHLVQPGAFASAKVQNLTLLCSNDGHFFQIADQITIASPAASVFVTPNVPVQCRYLRVQVDSHDGANKADVGIKIEVEGCSASSDRTVDDVCNAKPWWTADPPGMSKRMFLAAAGVLFMCDEKVDDDEETACFSTTDGATWTALNKKIRSVLAYDTVSLSFFALAQDKRSYVQSMDQGSSWAAVNEQKYQDALALPTTLTSKYLPGVKSGQFDDIGTVPDPSYSSINPYAGAKYPGMFWSGDSGSTWVQSANWDECCAAP